MALTKVDERMLPDPIGGSRNALINGDGAINQRSALYTTVADDTYWCDRHYVLAQTAAITPTILSDVANGIPSMMRLSQSQAVAQRMGNAQILESSISRALRGKLVTLGGKLRCSSSQPIRFAVLEWTGTADAPVSDAVNNWASADFTAGNFFNSTTLNVLAVGTITPAANTITPWTLTATVGANATNLIVLYWTEGTAAQNVTLDMRWFLAEGDATDEDDAFGLRHIAQELALCQRYYQLRSAGNTISATGAGQYVSADFHTCVEMRAVPTAAQSNESAPSNVSAVTIAALSARGGQAYCTSSGAGAAVFRIIVRLSAEL